MRIGLGHEHGLWAYTNILDFKRGLLKHKRGLLKLSLKIIFLDFDGGF